MGTKIDTAKSRQHVARSRLTYSIGAFGHDVFYALLSTCFVMYVTGHLFNSNSKAFNNHMVLWVASIIVVLQIVGLLIGPLIGNAIDRTNIRQGEFKSQVVGGGIISTVILAILFAPMGGLSLSNPYPYLLVLAILYTIMDIFYSSNDVAFWPMIPALSFDLHKCDKTATFARVGSTIGRGTVGFVIMPVVLFFSANQSGDTGDDRGWFIFAAIAAAVTTITAVGIGLGTHGEKSLFRKNKEQTKLRNVYKIPVENDQLFAIALSYLFCTTRITLINSMELYYFTYILDDSKAFSILGGLNTVIGVISVLVFPLFTNKINQHKLFYGSVSVLFLGLLIFAFVGESLILVSVDTELFFIPQPLVFLAALMTITDSVEYGQLKLGHRGESFTLSVRPLLDKFAGAVSGWIIGPTTIIAGMTAGATAATVTAAGAAKFKLVMFLAPAILTLISVFIFAEKVKLDEKIHAKIVAELKKTWGDHLEDADSDNPQTVSVSTPQPDITDIISPVVGMLVNLKDINDGNFASENMSKGFVIRPSDGKVITPFSRTVRATFSTRRAIGLESDSGIMLLIHVGIGTVKLHGTGFISYFGKDRHLNKGDELMEFWDPTIRKTGPDDTVMITVTNNKDFDVRLLKDVDEKVTTIDIAIEVTKK